LGAIGIGFTTGRAHISNNLNVASHSAVLLSADWPNLNAAYDLPYSHQPHPNLLTSCVFKAICLDIMDIGLLAGCPPPRHWQTAQTSGSRAWSDYRDQLAETEGAAKRR
jgi:hypothetical protein